MNDEALRAAYARAMPKPRSAERATCPTPDALISLVQRTGDETTRLATLDHTMACAACQREFELLRAIDAAEHREPGASRRTLRWQRPLMLALAASLVLAIGLGPGRNWLADRQPDTLRGEASAITVIGPDPGATIGGDTATLAWRSVPEATRYTVEVLTSDGTVRLGATTTDTTLLLRGVGDLPPGDYRWWVRAALPGGEQRSDARAITVRRE